MDDWTLLDRFVTGHADDAFAELVLRYAPMVRASAVRRAGQDMADDITQAVFILLARKAARLHAAHVAPLGGWLFKTTRFAAAEAIRKQKRIRQREDVAAKEWSMHEQPSSGDQSWDQVEPLLDAALDGLGSTDREIVLMRFANGASYALIGSTLHMTDNTATKRLARALEKLRRFLGRRGAALSVGALAPLLAAHTVEAASATLAETCAASALASASVPGPATAVTALAEGTLKAMLTAQVKTASALAASILAAGSLAVGTFVAVTPDKGLPFSIVGIQPFPLTYMAESILPDGTSGYQLNASDNTRTHFARLGEQIDGYTIAAHTVKPATRPAADVAELVLERGSIRVPLVRGQRPDPQWSVAVLSAGVEQPLSLLAGESFEWQGAKYELSSIDPIAGKVVVRRLLDGKTLTLERDGNKN